MWKKYHIIIPLSLLLGLVVPLQAETIYFLVGEIYPYHNDCYVLPLEDPFDIAHARDLINYGPDIGLSIVVAYIDWGVSINRNYVSPGLPGWSWYVPQFIGFADITAEILDGWPTAVEEGMFQGSIIGFWAYTVVAELGTFSEMQKWNCDLNVDGIVNFQDFAWFASKWKMSHNGGADINFDHSVNIYDLAIFADYWLQSLN